MAQYYTDFTETITAVDMTLDLESTLTLDSISERAAYELINIWRSGQIDSSGHPTIVENIDSGNVKAIRIAGGSASNRHFLAWVKAGLYRDVLIEGKIRLNNNSHPKLVLRGSGDGNNETGYTFYVDYAAQKLILRRYLGGNAISFDDANITFNLNTWYHLKAEAVGTTIRCRIWEEGATEPTDWLISYVDSDIIMGYCGISDSTTGPSFHKDLKVVGNPINPDGWKHGWKHPCGHLLPYIDDEVGTTGDKVLRVIYPATGGTRSVYWWTVPEASDEVEIRTRAKLSRVAVDIDLLSIQCMGVMHENGWRLRASSTGGNLKVIEYYQGEFSNKQSYSYSFSADEWLNIRVRHIGSTRKVHIKVWKDNESEPENWSFTSNVGPFAYVGFAGIGSYSTNVVQTYDFFGVGTGGDAAPDTEVI